MSLNTIKHLQTTRSFSKAIGLANQDIYTDSISIFHQKMH